MNDSKHEQLVRRIAEQMATEQYKSNFYSVQLGPPMPRTKFNPEHPMAKRAIKSIAENFIHAARIAVKHMAEAHEQGFRTGVRFANTGVSKIRVDDLFEKGLISEDERIKSLKEPRIEKSTSPNQPEP